MAAGIRSTGFLLLAGGLVLLAGCRGEEEPPGVAGGACEADTTGRIAAPIYTFDGEILDLDRQARARVDRWVRFFRDERPDLYARFLRRTGRYEAAIREELHWGGLPADFLYLALIESGMNPTAYSRAHAVGLWQFLASTGRMYGLEVSRLVDDRRSPARSTRAAIRYLNDLHDRFGDWFLAAAAYNGGPGRVGRALRRSGGGDFWTLASEGRLPRETADYVPKLLAAAWLAREPGLHGFGFVRPEAPRQLEELRLYGRNRLTVVAAAAGLSMEQLREWNPRLMGDVTPNSRWTVVAMPTPAVDRFVEVYPHIPTHHRAGTTPATAAVLAASGQAPDFDRPARRADD